MADTDGDAKIMTGRRWAAPLVLLFSAATVYAETRTIRGRLVDPNGTPIASAAIAAQDIEAADQRPSSVIGQTGADGSFLLTGENKLYVLIANPLPPLAQARKRVDARTSSPSEVEIVTMVGPDWPDTPPNPSLIAIGTPDSANRARVRGLPGSVPAESFVVCIILDTGHFTSVLAQPDGSFDTTIFAPPGSSLMIKTDPDGLQAWRMSLEASAGGEAAAAPLAGTILRLPERPRTDERIPFSATGLRDERAFPVWRLEGSVSSINLV
ncbi:MAG TPA: carboxypeptidase-like regulatory domain-containing protein, partial [Thermoanaerobaculia bacterium]